MSERSIKSQSQARFTNDNYRKNYDSIFRSVKSCTFCKNASQVKSTEHPCSACIDTWDTNGNLPYFESCYE